MAAVGDVDNYRRGSGRFGAIYARFASASGTMVLRIADGLAVVTVQRAGQPTPATAAIPVRLVAGRWLVDPILDVGSYSVLPQDGSTVAARPTVTARLDDPGTRARVWFDGNEAAVSSKGPFRPAVRLSAGWHVVTVVLQRGPDIVAHTIVLRVLAG